MLRLYLLCGLLCDKAVWSDIPRRLAGIASVQVVSFQGQSSIETMAESVLASPSPRFAVAGHSMGGRVALEMWRRAPHRIAALGLLNSAVDPPRDAEFASRSLLVRLARQRGMAAVAAHWLPPLLGAPPQRIAQIMPELVAMVERSTPDALAAQVRALLHRPDARPVLPTIDVPTLILSGGNDVWSSITQHADMLRSVPHARLMEIAFAGHMVPIERPDAVARELQNWLAMLQPAT